MSIGNFLYIFKLGYLCANIKINQVVISNMQIER